MTTLKMDMLSEIDMIFESFCGRNREWTFFQPPCRFTKPFFASSADEIIRRKLSLFGPQPVETHFSVELFNKINEFPDLADRINWTLIFDFDFGLQYQSINEGEEYEKKHRAMLELSRILDKFGLLYFSDSRNHLWVPEWQAKKVVNWTEMFGSNFVTNLHHYLTSVTNMPEGIYIDSNLWRVTRHKIRAPYSLHMETNTKQVLLYKGKEIPLEDLSYFWNGHFLPAEERIVNMNNFETFVKAADLYGGQIVEATVERIYARKGGQNYKYIDEILQRPIPIGYRGLILWLAILPYLANVKVVTMSEAVSIVEKWLDLSHGDRIKDADLYNYTSSHFNACKRKGIKPISLKNLVLKYPELGKLVKIWLG